MAALAPATAQCGSADAAMLGPELLVQVKKVRRLLRGDRCPAILGLA